MLRDRPLRGEHIVAHSADDSERAVQLEVAGLAEPGEEISHKGG